MAVSSSEGFCFDGELAAILMRAAMFATTTRAGWTVFVDEV